MRFKAILAEAARKRYPLSILLMVIGVLAIPFPYLFVHFGLELTTVWWTILSIGLGVILGCVIIGLGSLVEDVHDISMHTVGFDLELGELDEEDYEDEEDAPEAENEQPEAEPEQPEEAPADAE